MTKKKDLRADVYVDPITRQHHIGLAYLVERKVDAGGFERFISSKDYYLQRWLVVIVEPNEGLTSQINNEIDAPYSNLDSSFRVGRKLECWVNNRDMPLFLRESDNQVDVFDGSDEKVTISANGESVDTTTGELLQAAENVSR